MKRVIGAGQEIIEENGLGVCCNPENIDDIASGFQRMMQLTDAEKQSIHDAADFLMETRFCKEKIMQRVEILMKKVYGR